MLTNPPPRGRGGERQAGEDDAGVHRGRAEEEGDLVGGVGGAHHGERGALEPILNLLLPDGELKPTDIASKLEQEVAGITSISNGCPPRGRRAAGHAGHAGRARAAREGRGRRAHLHHGRDCRAGGRRLRRGAVRRVASCASVRQRVGQQHGGEVFQRCAEDVALLGLAG